MLNKQNLFGANDRYKRDTLNTTTPNATITPAPQTSSTAPSSTAPTTAAPIFESSRTPQTAIDTNPKMNAAPTAEEGKGGRLTVGPDIKLKGAEITDCDTLLVEGRVEASMDSRVIHIAEGGSFHGNVGIDVAEIWGEFNGELTARKQLIIHSTGRVSGTIRYGKLVIEEGGELAGDIASTTPASNSGSSRPASAGAKPNALQTPGTH